MKILNKRLAQALLITSLMLPWAATEALDKFHKIGYISKIGSSTFVVKKRQYRIAPGAKMKSESKSKRRFSDLREGDLIAFQGKKLNDRYYVDLIIYRIPEPE